MNLVYWWYNLTLYTCEVFPKLTKYCLCVCVCVYIYIYIYIGGHYHFLKRMLQYFPLSLILIPDEINLPNYKESDFVI